MRNQHRREQTTAISFAVALPAAASLFLLCFLFSFFSAPSQIQSPISLSSHRAQIAPGMAARRSFVLWLHGLGDSGRANEPIKTYFTSPEFNNARWSFPSAPNMPVSCNYGSVMPSWFDIQEIPVGPESPNDETGVMKAVKSVHAMIDKEISAGTDPENIFICGFSQGGALALASVLLFPRTLGGGAIFSGWVPFNSSIIGNISAEAKKTPLIWLHGIADRTVLFSAGQAGPPFLEQAGMTCEFKAYPNLAHSINDEELFELESWIKNPHDPRMVKKAKAENMETLESHIKQLHYNDKLEKILVFLQKLKASTVSAPPMNQIYA